MAPDQRSSKAQACTGRCKPYLVAPCPRVANSSGAAEKTSARASREIPSVPGRVARPGPLIRRECHVQQEHGSIPGRQSQSPAFSGRRREDTVLFRPQRSWLRLLRPPSGSQPCNALCPFAAGRRHLYRCCRAGHVRRKIGIEVLLRHPQLRRNQQKDNIR